MMNEEIDEPFKIYHGYFSINGIIFPIDPQGIAISEEIQNFNFETLRTVESIKVRSGHSRINITVSAVFEIDKTSSDEGYAGSGTDDLLRILYSMKRLPLCFIENELVRNSLPVSIDGYVDPDNRLGPYGEPIGAFLKAASVSTVPGSPDLLNVEFQFLWFNHRPFSPRIKFRRHIINPAVKQFQDVYSGNNSNSRQNFISKFGHPSVVFNATAQNDWTENIDNASSFQDWMFSPYGDKTGKYYDKLNALFPAFKLDTWDQDFEFDFIIPTNPDLITMADGTQKTVLGLVQEIQQVRVDRTVRKNAAPLGDPGAIAIGDQEFMSPLAGTNRITSEFGEIRKPRVTEKKKGLSSRMHKGVDLGCSEGTICYAIADGSVSHVQTKEEWSRQPVGTGKRYAGAFVSINHKNDFTSRYLHLDAIWVKPGPIKKGTPIGTVGMTGNEHSKCHLHFEVRHGPTVVDGAKGVAKNPRDFINFSSQTIVRNNGASKPQSVAQGAPAQEDVQSSYEDRYATILDPMEALRTKLEHESPDSQYSGVTDEALLALAKSKALLKTGDERTELDALINSAGQSQVFVQHSITGKVAQFQSFVLSPETLREEGGFVPVPMTLSVGFGNSITAMPLEGHRFPTAQYTGGQQTMGSISFRLEDSTRRFIRELKMLIHAYELSAINFREFSKRRGVSIRNSLFNALNIYDVLINSNAIDTIPGSPDGTFINIDLMNNSMRGRAPPILLPLRDGVQDNQGLNILRTCIQEGLIGIDVSQSFRYRMNTELPDLGRIGSAESTKNTALGDTGLKIVKYASKIDRIEIKSDAPTRIYESENPVLEAVRIRADQEPDARLASISPRGSNGLTEYTYSGGFSIFVSGNDPFDPLEDFESIGDPQSATGGALGTSQEVLRSRGLGTTREIHDAELNFKVTIPKGSTGRVADRSLEAFYKSFNRTSSNTTKGVHITGDFVVHEADFEEGIIDFGGPLDEVMTIEDFRLQYRKAVDFEGSYQRGLLLALFGGKNGSGLINGEDRTFEIWSSTYGKKLLENLGSAHGGTGSPLNSEFAKLYDRIAGGYEFEPGHEAYPDLCLPPNPITGLCIDTNPDFFFANDSDMNHCNTNTLRVVHGGDISHLAKVRGADRASYTFQSGHDNIMSLYGQNADGISPAHLGKDSMYGGVDGFNRGKFKTYAPRSDSTLGRLWNSVAGSAETREGSPPDLTGFSGSLDNVDTSMENNIGERAHAGYDRTAAMEKFYQDSVYKEQTIDWFTKGDTSGETVKNMIKVRHDFNVDSYKSTFGKFAESYESNHYAIRRAFPAFKVYLIEENGEADSEQAESRTGEIVNKLTSLHALDDFYSVNAIKQVSIVHAKDMAASTCTIEILDLEGVLYNQKYDASDSPVGLSEGTIDSTGHPVFKNRIDGGTNPFFSTMIKEGTKVIVKMGYFNDPDALDTMFVGQIAHFEGTHILTIVCQSYGTELVAQQFGSDPSENVGQWNTRTEDMLHDLLDREEVRHFGRWKLSDIKIFGGIFGVEKLRPDGKVYNIYTWRPSVVDDNLFIPAASTYSTGWARLWGDLEYVYGNTTIWDVFKEMELRHPGHIAYPVTYGTGADARMTMFFGNPDQPYLSRPASSKFEVAGEIDIENGHANRMSEVFALIGVITSQAETTTPRSGLSSSIDNVQQGMFNVLVNEKNIDWDLITHNPGFIDWSKRAPGQSGTELIEQFKEDLGREARNYINAMNEGLVEQGKTPVSTDYEHQSMDYYRSQMSNLAAAWQGTRLVQFRNYELVTSMHDIIANNISADHRGTYNSIELHYSDNDVNLGTFDSSEPESFTVNADDNIKEHHIRRNIESYPNCSTSDLAKRYASQLLANSLMKTYQGNLMIIGKPKLKPYDIIWLYDNYSDMAGPIEIDEVVHTFSQETGLISDIIPNLLVSVKDEVKLLTTDALGVFFTETLGDFTKGFSLGLGITAIASAGVLALTKPAAELAIEEGALSASYAATKEALKKESLKEILSKGSASAQAAKDTAKIVKDLAVLNAKEGARNTLLLTNGSIGMAGAAARDTEETGNQFAWGIGSGLAVGALSAIAPIAVAVSGIMAGWAAYKFMKYNLTREPIVVTPLIRGGKPFITGLEGMESDGLLYTDLNGVWNTSTKKWKHFEDGLGDASDLIKYGWANLWNGNN